MPHQRRRYRGVVAADGLVRCAVRMGQTNLVILADEDLAAEARALTRAARAELHSYRRRHPAFFESLEPVDASDDAPSIAREMAAAARAVGVGPMAAVAGAIAQRVGAGLQRRSRNVIVENGGDIYLRVRRPRLVGIQAGRDPLSLRLALEVRPEETPLGIACSSGTVGPSLSFGKADAAVVVADDAVLADAAATALGNRVRSCGDMEPAVARACAVKGVRGAVVLLEGALAAKGSVSIVPVRRR